MAGISLGVMGGATAHGTSAGYSSSAVGSATDMGFGPGYTNAGTPNDKSALWTASHASFAFYAAVLSVVALCVIRHSLPR
jgi:hypothetical protein